jgi:hypothetical protein
MWPVLHIGWGGKHMMLVSIQYSDEICYSIDGLTSTGRRRTGETMDSWTRGWCDHF